MKTWNVTDAAGKQHQVSADSMDVRFSCKPAAGDFLNVTVASFTKPIAVTEAAPHLIDESGTDLGEIMSVHLRSAHVDDETQGAYMVYVRKES